MVKVRGTIGQTGRFIAVAVRARPRLATAIVIIVFGVVGALFRYVIDPPPPIGQFGGPGPPAEVEALLADVFSGSQCHHPDDSEAEVRAGLDSAGLQAWTVFSAVGVGPDDCVSSTIDTVGQRIVLISAVNPDVGIALAAVAEDLLQECRTKDEAADLVRSTLVAAGATHWELRTDGGPMGPIDRMDEIRAHFEAGCWIYSGTGTKEDGTRLFWIGGRS